MQHARRLVRVPGGIDVRTVPEQELGDLETMIQTRPGESGVEHLLRGRGISQSVYARPMVPVRVSENRVAALVKPTFHGIEISCACRMR